MTEEKVSDLCDEKGTGMIQVNWGTEEIEQFFPILMTIEFLIAKHYRTNNDTLNDRMVMDYLKRLRDNIFKDDFKFEEFELELIEGIKDVLRQKKYSKHDVLMCISKVLNSVRLHRTTSEITGQGYLEFIARQFESAYSDL